MRNMGRHSQPHDHAKPGDNPADEWVGTIPPRLREDHEADDANEQTNAWLRYKRHKQLNPKT